MKKELGLCNLTFFSILFHFKMQKNVARELEAFQANGISVTHIMILTRQSQNKFLYCQKSKFTILKSGHLHVGFCVAEDGLKQKCHSRVCSQNRVCILWVTQKLLQGGSMGINVKMINIHFFKKHMCYLMFYKMLVQLPISGSVQYQILNFLHVVKKIFFY